MSGRLGFSPASQKAAETHPILPIWTIPLSAQWPQNDVTIAALRENAFAGHFDWQMHFPCHFLHPSSTANANFSRNYFSEKRKHWRIRWKMKIQQRNKLPHLPVLFLKIKNQTNFTYFIIQENSFSQINFLQLKKSPNFQLIKYRMVVGGV